MSWNEISGIRYTREYPNNKYIRYIKTSTHEYLTDREKQELMEVMGLKSVFDIPDDVVYHIAYLTGYFNEKPEYDWDIDAILDGKPKRDANSPYFFSNYAVMHETYNYLPKGQEIWDLMMDYFNDENNEDKTAHDF